MSSWSRDYQCEIPDPMDVDAQLDHRLRRRFNRACREMAAVLVEVRKVAPHANYYSANGSLSLLVGPPHDRTAGMPCGQPQRVLWDAPSGLRIDGGDW